MTDSMTGLYNREHFFESVNSLLQNKSLSSLIICDIDYFKSVNDTYGHCGGDAVIIALSKLLTDNSPKESVIARFGGEEFVIYLPNMSQEQGKQVAETLRSKIEITKPMFEGQEIAFTASFGVHTFTNPQIDTAIIHADEALYQAKQSGRNTVVVYE